MWGRGRLPSSSWGLQGFMPLTIGQGFDRLINRLQADPCSVCTEGMLLKEPIPVLGEIRPCWAGNACATGLSDTSNDHPLESNGFPSRAFCTAQVEVGWHVAKRPVCAGLFCLSSTPFGPDLSDPRACPNLQILVPFGVKQADGIADEKSKACFSLQVVFSRRDVGL